MVGPADAALSDREGAILYAFHDDNQKLYRRSSELAGLFEESLFATTCAIRAASAADGALLPGTAHARARPEGQDVERITIQDE